MSKKLAVFGGAALAASLAFAQSGTELIRLQSVNNRFTEVRIRNNGVTLNRRMSDAPCTLNRTWGFDRDRIWVDFGCRAEFRVRRAGGSGSGGGGGWNPTGPHIGQTRFVRVDSIGGRLNKTFIGTGYRVWLNRRFSSQPCVNGRSWGYRSGQIWVDNGCRAEFAYRR